MNDNIKFYLPFTKKNDDERIVEGWATTESIDSQGEVVNFNAIKKALPDYMKYGNIREMHQWSAVGKAINAKTDDTRRGLYLKAKVIDDIAWQKCKEGVYNGYSIGGKVLKKVDNEIQELSLNEISLVDRPANPDAEFTIVKFQDGKAVDINMHKSLPVEPTGMDEDGAIENEEVLIADSLVAMAARLVWLVRRQKEMKRPTKHVEGALNALKEAAIAELKVQKRLAEQDKQAEDVELAVKLDALKDELSKQINKPQDSQWTDGYFKQARKVV